MKIPAQDDDATVVVRRPAAIPPSAASPPPPRPRGRLGLAAGGAGAVILAGVLAWVLWPRPVPQLPAPAPVAKPAPASVAPPSAVRPAPTPAAPPAPAPAAPLAIATITADEATIRDHAADRLTVFRFAADPSVIVLDFPTLHMQGATLNRLAALIEKAGAPRDRVLTDAELAATISKGGDTPDTYYYGHDYSAAAVARFFALADAQRVRLTPEEGTLRAMATQFGWFAPDAVGALISVSHVPDPAAPTLDEAARAAILHHELSHGLFFSDPVYAAYVRQFWDTSLTEAERDSVRRFLGSEGYDMADEALMYNEMQAYVLFTYDPRFCKPGDFGMTPARRLEVAEAFLRDMPPSWLRDSLAEGIARLR